MNLAENPGWPARPILPALVGIAAVLLGGCAAPPTLMVNSERRPVAALNLAASGGGLDLALDSAIYFRGPGAWKYNAYWDEYVVRLSNRGPVPITVEAVTLTDLVDRTVEPGTDPWRLEEAGRKQADGLRRLGASVAPGELAPHPDRAGYLRSATGKGAASMVLLPLVISPVGGIVLVMAPVVLMKEKADEGRVRAAVQAEINHRRLVLPLALVPGAEAKGSLFFPLTPGPVRLTARLQGAAGPTAVPLELRPLSGLHFNYPPDAAALKAALQAAAAPRR